MGYYTTFIGSFGLKKETPKEVIGTLLYMTGAPDPEKIEPLPECFNDCGRADHMLRSNNELPGAAYCNLIRADDRYHLSFRCNFKNYDNEIDIFMHWLAPWICPGAPVAQAMTEDGYFKFFSVTVNSQLSIVCFSLDDVP